MAERRKVRPDCIYASNPFHECTEYCIKKTAESKAEKDKKSKGSWLDISKSFGRKKGSRPKPPNEVDGGRYSSSVSTEAGSLNSRITPKNNVESRNGGHISPTKRFYSEDRSLSAEQPPRIPSYESLIMPDYPEDAPKQSWIRMTNNMNGDGDGDGDGDEKHETLYKKDLTPNVKNAKQGSQKPSSESSFSLSGFEQTLVDDSDDEGEIESVNSEMCVPVGKYNVKASFSSILTSIFENYGDIATTCKLESVSMRSYYLQCVCYVIQELQSIEFHQLTKSKVKELLAIVKDVESSQINVGWLKSGLDEISQAVELRSQHRVTEAAKADCQQNLESTKKELEFQTKDLALKEQEVSDAKTKVAETRARVTELELKSSQLEELIASMNSKVQTLRSKSFTDGLL